MRNQSRRSLFAALLVLAGFLPAAFAQQASTNATHHCLWKAEGKQSAVYLLGSVHVMKRDSYPLPSVIETAFTNAAIVAFEADIGAMESPTTQLKILATASLPEGETLQGRLSPEAYTAFTNYLASEGQPLAVFAVLKPSVSMFTLTALELQKLGLDPENGIDKHFYALAKKQHKEIVPLETLDFQISLVTDYSREEENLLVKAGIRDMKQTQTETSAMLSAWQTGDATKLNELLNDMAVEAPTLFKRLVTDRSRSWVPKIEQWLKGDKTAIVIVGAGHLVGDEGVVELLRRKGYKVTQE